MSPVNNPPLIVISGKTASGKDTVMGKLLSRFPEFKRVITTTSRSPRADEVNGVDYNFISEEDFRQKIERGNFIEYVKYAGNFYGTEKSQMLAECNLIWRIDPSRAGQIKDLIKDRKVLVIYLTVDDSVVLSRLVKRGFPQEEIDRRMREDLNFWKKYKDNYDYIVENVPGKLKETLAKITQIINT